MARYLKNDFQQILKAVLDSRPLPASVPALVVAFHYKNPYKRPLKARFANVYQAKTHIKCDNFFQQCKDHFAIAGAMGPNRVLFTTTFLKHIDLLCW